MPRTDTGYCQIADVGSVLQDTFEGADPSPAHVKDAIRGENEWLRKTTRRHFYDPDFEPAADQDDPITLPTAPIGILDEERDIPASPHPQRGQLAVGEERVYPQTHRGHYARVRLNRRDVTALDALHVRQGSDYEDWIADPTKSAGRSGDYSLHVDPHTGRSAVYLDARQLHPAVDYQGAVLASYQYGHEGLPETVRRAVALRAAASLVLDEDANVQIPDQGAMIPVESKASKLRSDAEAKLKSWRATPVG